MPQFVIFLSVLSDILIFPFRTGTKNRREPAVFVDNFLSLYRSYLIRSGSKAFWICSNSASDLFFSSPALQNLVSSVAAGLPSAVKKKA